MKHIIRSLGATMAVATALTIPAVGPAAAASISNTGPGSFNQIITTNNSVRFDGRLALHRRFLHEHRMTTITNNNNVSISNHTFQFAQSGNAVVSDNTFGGSARTGSATNVSSTSTSVNINNNTRL